MKKFEVPEKYRSSIISEVKNARKISDPRKKDFSPTLLDFGPVRFYIARHFGFCYGVENAIEIAYKTLEQHPDKRIFLLSQMIHNPEVNNDLTNKGIHFIMDTKGNKFMELDELNPEDIVIIPAFGTTIEMMEDLNQRGVEVKQYDTTCPFVTAVWKRAGKLGQKDHTVIIHGKPDHEETRATFSHSEKEAPSIIVRNIEEARILTDFIKGKNRKEDILDFFQGNYSEGFDPQKHLKKVGVVNQTTMLASETQAIADHFKQTMKEVYGEENMKEHFADTKDTLCYATNDNQNATYGLLEKNADLAVVVGGYNSSNTTHIVELCESKFPTYFISSEREIESPYKINHFDFHSQKRISTENYLPQDKSPVDIVLTSGASCPDSSVDKVLKKLLGFFEDTYEVEEVLKEFESGK
ncbi:MAG: 4-hydroxy-3-methylbut-2-enyl diphosphate reductase [Flavobacteriales bacterium]